MAGSPSTAAKSTRTRTASPSVTVSAALGVDGESQATVNGDSSPEAKEEPAVTSTRAA